MHSNRSITDDQAGARTPRLGATDFVADDLVSMLRTQRVMRRQPQCRRSAGLAPTISAGLAMIFVARAAFGER